MQEIDPDKQFESYETSKAPVVLENTDIDDLKQILMLQTALLMRLYDVQMEILGSYNQSKAKALWDKHEAGSHNNPPTYIPVFERVENQENPDETQ